MRLCLSLFFIVIIFSSCENILNKSSNSAIVYDDNNLTISDKSAQRNDFYGYGKLNLTKLIENVAVLENKSENLKGEYYNQQWALEYDESFYIQYNINKDAHINPTTVYKNFTGTGVTVAVIDNGFDIEHPEIKDKIIAKIAFDENGNSSTDVTHTNSDEYHGTSVAGIISSTNDNIGINGIAPDINLILIKMPEFITSSIIVDMFDFAINNGADIINCSWGTNMVSDIVRDKLNDIAQNAKNGQGVITIFASGNSNSLMTTDESAVEGVISVSSTDYDNLRTEYSNFGKELDIVAPGGYNLGITTIDPVGTNGATNNEYNLFDQVNGSGEYIQFVGTSAAAPVVSGAIALLLEADNTLSFDQVLQYLKSSSDKISQNLPYINDMISSSSNTPTITGIIPESSSYTIMVKLISNTTLKEFGNYQVVKDGDVWTAQVTDVLLDDDYTIEVIDINNIVLATDQLFVVNAE